MTLNLMLEKRVCRPSCSTDISLTWNKIYSFKFQDQLSPLKLFPPSNIQKPQQRPTTPKRINCVCVLRCVCVRVRVWFISCLIRFGRADRVQAQHQRLFMVCVRLLLCVSQSIYSSAPIWAPSSCSEEIVVLNTHTHTLPQILHANTHNYDR